jgi:hypothetical protein
MAIKYIQYIFIFMQVSWKKSYIHGNGYQFQNIFKISKQAPNFRN